MPGYPCCCNNRGRFEDCFDAINTLQLDYPYGRVWVEDVTETGIAPNMCTATFSEPACENILDSQTVERDSFGTGSRTWTGGFYRFFNLGDYYYPCTGTSLRLRHGAAFTFQCPVGFRDGYISAGIDTISGSVNIGGDGFIIKDLIEAFYENPQPFSISSDATNPYSQICQGTIYFMPSATEL